MTTEFSRLKRNIAVLTVICMVLILVSVDSFALETSDISNHWAKDRIQSWMDQGLIKGYEDGTFRPDNNITRAEFISLVNGAFGFKESAKINYTDVDANAWYIDMVATAKAANYISGYPDNTIRPNNPISREEAASIIMKIKNLEASSSGTAKFIDESSFGWSKDAVNAVSDQNIMNGYPDGSFKPQEFIKRAEAVVALDKALAYSKNNITYNKAGTYGPFTGVSEIEGNVTVTEKDIILQNMIIKGNLIIGKNVGDGNVTLKNITVKGETKIYGGGQNSIIVIDSTLGKVTVSKQDGKIRIIVSGNTTVKLVQAISGVKLEEKNLTNSSAGFQEIVLDASENDAIILVGSFDKVILESEGLEIQVPKGTIVDTLIINKKAKITGTGTVNIANVNASGVTFETAPKTMNVAKDIIAPIIGAPKAASRENSSKVEVSAIDIKGNPVVGQVLTANPTPANATVTYQWMRSDTANGTFTDITGAINKIYTLTGADLNKFIKVTVTGTGSYTRTLTSSATETVTYAATLERVATPVITPSKTTAANREEGVTFTVSSVGGVTFYYTVDGSTPSAISIEYKGAVTLTAPDQDTEGTITVKVIGVQAGSTDSEVATETVTYAAKPEGDEAKVIFSVPTAKETGTYYPEQGYSIETINKIQQALWGTQPTTIAGVYLKPIFSADGGGSELTINADNITQSLLDWLEHDLGTEGRIAIGMSFSGGLGTASNDSNIINGSEGTPLLRLLVNSEDWQGTTVRINLHNLVPGLNYGGISTTDGAIGPYEAVEDGVIANFEVKIIGNLTPVSSVTVTTSATTISVDDGTLQMYAEILPLDSYDKTVRWSVKDVSGVARISNAGHGTTGLLFAGKNGTVQVYATSANNEIISEPLKITISNQVGPAAPSGIGKTDETVAGKNDGTLTGVAAGQEYQINGEGSWIKIEGTTVTGLAPGSYTVRIAETDVAYAGTPSAPLVIATGASMAAKSIVTRDPGNTGGVEATFDASTNTFGGTIDYYTADSSAGRNVAGNYVGVQITAPENITVDKDKATLKYTNASGEERTLINGKTAWMDGDYFVYYYPLVTAEKKTFTVVIDWDGDGMAYVPETIIITVAADAILEAAQ